MRFWDSSAVVPLCLAEPQTSVVRPLVEADPTVVVWWGTRTECLLAVHPLRAADGFQLAAALLWSRGETAGRHFVSFDQRLREAARREGFAVLP